jgi:hypothetical protein
MSEYDQATLNLTHICPSSSRKRELQSAIGGPNLQRYTSNIVPWHTERLPIFKIEAMRLRSDFGRIHTLQHRECWTRVPSGYRDLHRIGAHTCVPHLPNRLVCSGQFEKCVIHLLGRWTTLRFPVDSLRQISRCIVIINSKSHLHTTLCYISNLHNACLGMHILE